MIPGFYDDEFDDEAYVLNDLADCDAEIDTCTAERFEEIHRQRRIQAGIEDACRVCGCSETRPCEGGCIWVESDLCSRCYRAMQAMGKAFSAGGSE